MTQVPLTVGRAEPVINVGDRPALLINRDITNSILIGESQDFALGGDSGYSIIDPLGSIAVDGKSNQFAKALTGNPTLDVATGATNWAPSPAQVAAQINALGLAKDTTVNGLNTGIPGNIATTGAPLINKSAIIQNQTLHSIAASTLFAAGTFSVGQIGYEINIGVQANAGSLYPFIKFELVWTDSVTGLTISNDVWFLAGGSGVLQTYYGTGPSKGDTVTINVTNLDTVNAISVQFVIANNSRVYVRDDWRNITTNNIPNFTRGNYSPGGNFLLQAAPSVNAGATQTRWASLYAGRVRLWATGQLPYDITVSSLNADISTAPAGNQIFEDKVTAAGGGFMTDGFAIGRGVTLIALTNNGGAIQTIGVTLIVDEQQA